MMSKKGPSSLGIQRSPLCKERVQVELSWRGCEVLSRPDGKTQRSQGSRLHLASQLRLQQP